MKSYLERMPKARERSKKNLFLANLLLKKYGSELQIGLTPEILERMIVSAATYDRAWRQVLEHEDKLRGTDYESKEALEQEVQIGLGYEPGNYKRSKEVNKKADESS